MPIRKCFKSNSMMADVFRRFLKNKLALISLMILCVIVLCAVFANLIVPYNKAISQDIVNKLQPPSMQHWFGTDQFGRDVFARILYGTRISLLIGVCTTAGALLISGFLGSVAGYYGGRVDNIIMRLMDVLMCIPAILLAMTVIATLGQSIQNMIIAIGISQISGFCRIIRSVILNLKGMDFIEAAKSCGARDGRIILTHIIPNAIGPIIVQCSMNIAVSIIGAASLSFIGLGVSPPTPEWGIMLSEAKDHMRTAPYLSTIPGIAIVVTALSFNLLGDGLRDALDPRLKD